MTHESYWICRTWTETSRDGWTGNIAPFDTEKEAEEYGRAFLRNINREELAREYEVYKAQ